jgi:hypothetical protein
MRSCEHAYDRRSKPVFGVTCAPEQAPTVQACVYTIQILSSLRWGIAMDGAQPIGWFDLSWMIDHIGAAGLWQLLTVQNLATLVSTGIAIWKWWEAREANLFFRFERMISRYEHQLVTARSDLLDVISRPGPGVLIRTPLFVTWTLRAVLQRRRWYPSSILPFGRTLDKRLEQALVTCNRKVSAHLGRLSFFRQQVASARLIQGALAAARAVNARLEHDRQRLDLEALDHFRGVLAIPGHHDDLGAHELIAHQLARLDQRSQLAVSSYTRIIELSEQQPASPARNRLLARAKRCLAALIYPSRPGNAERMLLEAIELLTEFGPPPDRDLLELAQTYYMDGIARLRLGANVQGPQHLSLAQGHYRELIRSLRARRSGLFRWMLRESRFSGHRVRELRERAEYGLAQVNHLIKLNDEHQDLLIASLKRGNGLPRHNRKLPR